MQVISGWQLPKEDSSGHTMGCLDPYVQIDINGVPADIQKAKTNKIKNNGKIHKENKSFGMKHKDKLKKSLKVTVFNSLSRVIMT